MARDPAVKTDAVDAAQAPPSWPVPGIDTLIAPLDPGEFMREVRGCRAWSHRVRSDRFEGLMDWSRLNRLIRDHDPAAPHFRLVREGRTLPEWTWHRTVSTLRGPRRQLDAGRLMAELREGASVVWDSIDRVDDTLRALRHGVERALSAQAFVNLYASFGTRFGFGEHWDDHDVLVLQLLGRKRWRLRRPTRRWPLPGEEAPPPGGPCVHDWTLRPGSVLYLPRGWWHRVTPLGEPSLHLTIGVLEPTNLDFLRWVVDMAAGAEALRQELPAGLTPGGRRTHAAALRRALAPWISADGIEAYERARAASLPPEPWPSLQAVASRDPGSWAPDAAVRLATTAARIERRGRAHVLHLAPLAWPIPPAGRATVQRLVDGDTVPLAMLLGGVGHGLVSELVTSGILVLV